MNKTLFIIICVLLLLIILAVVFFILYFGVKSRGNGALNVVLLIKKAKKPSINQINEFLKSKTASKDDLNILSEYFLANFKLPKKSEKLTDEAKEQLNFIKNFAASKNADAKMISALNAALRKINQDYKDEIEEMEKRGIKSRG